tara:strand:- start:241 stop:906 length:666 start_codon:yes stop_codon:yes gene_type:complete
MYEYKKIKDKIIIFKNNKELLTPNKNFLCASTTKMAKSIVTELKKFERLDQYKTPVSFLAFFSSNLIESDKNLIIKKIIEEVFFDNILYRSNKNEELNTLMNKEFNKYITNFRCVFKIDLILIEDLISGQQKLKTDNLYDYLKGLDNYRITLFYKLMQISKSVILSYSLMNRMFGFLKFKRLINFENDFQTRKWGITSEQKVINLEIQKNIKNFSIFFNNF